MKSSWCSRFLFAGENLKQVSRRLPRDLVCDALAWCAQDKTAPGSGRRFLRHALEDAHHGFADNLHDGASSSDGHHDIWLAHDVAAARPFRGSNTSRSVEWRPPE